MMEPTQNPISAFSVTLRNWNKKGQTLDSFKPYRTASMKFARTTKGFWGEKTSKSFWKNSTFGNGFNKTTRTGFKNIHTSRKQRKAQSMYMQRLKKYKANSEVIFGMKHDQDYFIKDTKDEVENLDKWLYDNKKNLSKYFIMARIQLLTIFQLIRWRIKSLKRIRTI